MYLDQDPVWYGERNRYGQDHKYKPRQLRALSKQIRFYLDKVRTYGRFWKDWSKRV